VRQTPTNKPLKALSPISKVKTQDSANTGLEPQYRRLEVKTEMSEEWKEDPTVKKWFKQVNTKRTIQNYSWEFPRFLDFIKMTPSQMIEKRLQQLTTTNPQERHYFENKFVEFKHKLENEALRLNSIKGYLRTVRSFFSNNNVPLVLNRSETKVSPQNKEDRVTSEWTPTNEEIRLLYRMTNTARDRAILLTLYQSGFSEVDVASMDIEDLFSISKISDFC